MGKREHPRSFRVADSIQREVSLLIKAELSDPRVNAVTVLGVEVSPDLCHAEVFVVTTAGNSATAIIKVLNHAAGFFRARLSKRLKMRYLPQIRFRYDTQYEQAMRITALIEAHRQEKITNVC